MFGYIGTISYLLLKRYSSSLAMIKPKILVTGATGKTGGAVVTELLAKGWPVRAAVRVHHARSDRLQRRGAEIVVVDIFDPIDRMFAALPNFAHTAVTPGFFADSPFLEMMPIAAHLGILPLPVAGESRNAPRLTISPASPSLPSDFSFPAAYGDLFAVGKAVFAEQSKGCFEHAFTS